MSERHELWNHSLISRLAMLKPGTTRVAYLAAKPDLGTFRYRAFNPVDCLLDSNSRLTASYFFLPDLEKIDDLSALADILVAVRLPYDDRVDRIFRTFSRKGKKIFFDVDDLVIDLRLDSTVASDLGYELRGESLYRWSAFIANWSKSLMMSDEVITSTKTLGKAISNITNHPVHIIPNTFNRYQAEASAPRHGPFAEKKGLNLGYFSGSQSHEHDFALVKPALVSYLSANPNSRLTIVGHLNIGTDMKAVGHQISQMHFMDFRELQGAIADVDLNIAPLQQSPFTAAKSELKYFEAALAGTPTLASRNTVFSDVIIHGVTGFLASSTEWGSVLNEIDSLGVARRLEIASAAREHALSAYSPRVLSAKLEKLFLEDA